MGFWDILDTVLTAARRITDELGKDDAGDIVEWLHEADDMGAASAFLTKEDGKGIAHITGISYDDKGNVIDETSWDIECNTGFKKIMEGDQSGLYDIFQGQDEVIYEFDGSSENEENKEAHNEDENVEDEDIEDDDEDDDDDDYEEEDDDDEYDLDDEEDEDDDWDDDDDDY